jgi:2-polyprenyl-3-methyl-5-hydroxy-6-metoxy-1,4-benzoquinol methylase
MDVVERLTLEAAQADTMIACEHRQRYEFAAGLSAGRRVLDLCCGSGYGSAILAARAQAVVGIDNDAATVERARLTVGNEAPNVSFSAADAAEFLGGDIASGFDLVVCFEGLEHLHGLDHVLALLRHHVGRGVQLVASVPNDKLTGDRNEFHVTSFGYDEAVRAFAGFPSVVMVPQFLAEGSLICPTGATEVEVEVTLEDRDEPEYANHFIFCVGFDPAEVGRAHRGKIQLNTSPVFNRWSEDLKQGAWALRRENARVARARLGKGGSAAASALAGLAAREAQIAELQARCLAAEARVAELESALAAPEAALDEEPVPRVERVIEAVEARELEVAEDGDPNSWDLRRRRAAEVLLPWIEQSVPLDGLTVLEYGCGNGAVSTAVAERAGRVVGIDIDARWIEEGRERIRARGVDNAVLELHPVEHVLAATAAYRGQVDVFLLYAVLEHLSVAERIEVLRLARDVVKPDGAIVVCETPNRLIYFDHHTAQIPFFHMMPGELALEYRAQSPRVDFTSAIEAALQDGTAAGLEALVRWGTGVSFHEFEVVFGDRLDRHVLASNYDPLLFGERPIHPEEVILARYLSRVRPDLAPVWSRYWLDLILSPTRVDRRPPLLRPWTAETTASTGVGWTAWENLELDHGGAAVQITLPQPTSRVVVGSVTLDGHWLALSLLPEGRDGALLTHHRAPAGVHAFTTFELSAPARRMTLTANDQCYVVFVGYED